MNDQLRTDLAELRAEIDRVEAGESDLSTLADLIHRAERTVDPEDEHAELGLLDRLEEQIAEYEAEHPALTNVVARVINTLSAAGL